MVTTSQIGYSVRMENRTQPILCCVGADVAGQPTQFLMERAVLASHLDCTLSRLKWPTTNWPKLGWHERHAFSGGAFFSNASAQCDAPVTELSRRSLYRRYHFGDARRDKWVAWHNSGPPCSISYRSKWLGRMQFAGCTANLFGRAVSWLPASRNHHAKSIGRELRHPALATATKRSTNPVKLPAKHRLHPECTGRLAWFARGPAVEDSIQRARS